MTTPGRLVSNSVVAAVGSVTQRLLHFGTALLLARGLGGEQFGVYAFVSAYMSLFGFIVDLGFERVIARELARAPERSGELLGTGFIMRAILSTIAAAAAVGVAWAVRLPELTRWCIFLAALGMPLSVDIFVRSFFQVRFQVHYNYLLTMPGSIMFVALAALVLSLGGNLLIIFGVALITGVFSVSLMLWVGLPKMHVVWRLNPQLVRYLWRESWELGAAFLVWLITWRIDQVLLYWLRGPSELAQYAVAVKITEALSLISESVMVTIFPLLASTQVSAPERFRRIYQLTVRYLVVIVLPIALVLTWERDWVLRLLFGAGYAAAGPALVILAWWAFFAYMGAVYVSLMIVRSQQRLIAQVSTVSLVINVALNFICVPVWGAAGAAAAMLVTSASSFALFCVAPQSRNMMRVCCDEAVRPLVAVGTTALLLALFAPPALRAFATVPLYAVILSLIGGVDRDDWQLARQLWRATPDA